MASFKGIEFAEGYKSSFADFKKEFQHVKHFRDLHPEKREIELKKAHKEATKWQQSTSKQKEQED